MLALSYKRLVDITWRKLGPIAWWWPRFTKIWEELAKIVRYVLQMKMKTKPYFYGCKETKGRQVCDIKQPASWNKIHYAQTEEQKNYLMISIKPPLGLLNQTQQRFRYFLFLFIASVKFISSWNETMCSRNDLARKSENPLEHLLPKTSISSWFEARI